MGFSTDYVGTQRPGLVEKTLRKIQQAKFPRSQMLSRRTTRSSSTSIPFCRLIVLREVDRFVAWRLLPHSLPRYSMYPFARCNYNISAPWHFFGVGAFSKLRPNLWVLTGSTRLIFYWSLAHPIARSNFLAAIC